MGLHESWNSSVSLVEFVRESRDSLRRMDSHSSRSRQKSVNYTDPVKSVDRINQQTRAVKRSVSLRKRFLEDRVIQDFPNICRENLDAKIMRLHLEVSTPTISLYDRSRRFLHQPFISETSPDRRYRVWKHTGDVIDGAYSCCLAQAGQPGGCSYHVKNPDARCYLP